MENNSKCKIQLMNEDGTLFAQSTFTDENYENHV